MFRHDSMAAPRDHERRQRIMTMIDRLWERYPQLRLGQLLVNVDKRFETNPFFVEDDEIEASLKRVLDNGF